MHPLLSSKNKVLKDLLIKTKEAEKLTQLVLSFLDQDLQSHCKVLHLNQGCLTIAISSAALATKFRYVTSDLLKQLRTTGKLYQLRSIKTIVEQSHSLSPTVSATSHELSNESCDIIRNTAKGIQSEVLRKALEKLADHK